MRLMGFRPPRLACNDIPIKLTAVAKRNIGRTDGPIAYSDPVTLTTLPINCTCMENCGYD